MNTNVVLIEFNGVANDQMRKNIQKPNERVPRIEKAIKPSHTTEKNESRQLSPKKNRQFVLLIMKGRTTIYTEQFLQPEGSIACVWRYDPGSLRRIQKTF
jgi:hypothetical protein